MVWSDQQWAPLDGTTTAALRLAPTLLSGMSFRWERSSDDTYVGVLDGVICELRESGESVDFRSSEPDVAVARTVLRRHLRLDDGLIACESEVWRSALPQFRRTAAVLPGCRVLRILDPLEALITFIGSANNNIKRNMQMVKALCAHFPENRLGCDAYGSEHHRFPTVKQLLTLSEQQLWELGWGYRAPRVHKVARQLHERGGELFCQALAPMTEEDARGALCELCGVGRKVADCVLLFGYGHDGCVPVDTHCLQIAQRFLLPSIRGKPLSAGVYSAIVARFHELFGAEFAGWAFMTLFVVELSDFRGRLKEPAVRGTTSPHFEAAATLPLPPRRGKSKQRGEAASKPEPVGEEPKEARTRRKSRQQQPSTPATTTRRAAVSASPRSAEPTPPRKAASRRAARLSPYFA
tara:strand:+ start:1246 stop:2472 length:1227 start_codon:yes stop_codon:yes gene_type:complete